MKKSHRATYGQYQILCYGESWKMSSEGFRIFAVSPYPRVLLNADTAICYGSRVLLQGQVLADLFSWSPTNSLMNAGSLMPTAGPTQSTDYILTVRNISGCLKTVSDTVHVTVIPTIHVDAGNDTTIVANQPLQMNATGGTNYLWSPVTGLSDPGIANPVLTLPAGVDSILYKVTASDANGCKASDLIKVRVFNPILKSLYHLPLHRMEMAGTT